jgi:(R,R)-butanediol dehydrogenase/meso-butanediol dehydrogenase/diacetyl reductase
MRALRWHDQKSIRLDEVPEPGPPGPGTVLVEVAFCGLCGTDLHEVAHGPNMIRTSPHPLSGAVPPLTMGHEMSGTVVQVGPGVSRVVPGTRVAVDPCLRCGTCRWCTRGEYHICERGGSIGLAADGGFARHVHVPAEQLCPVPDGVSLDHAAVAEPLAVGLHAARRGGIGPGDHVLVLGAGPIGIAAVIGARVAGAASVIVSEPLPGRSARALALGATLALDPTTTDVRREAFLRTGRIGPDVVIDATGRPELVDLAVRTVRRGGRVVVAGISDTIVPLDLRQLVLFERNLHGSLGYNHDIPRALDLMAAGRIDAGQLVTAIRPLSAGPEVFAELADDPDKHLKVLLTPQGD